MFFQHKKVKYITIRVSWKKVTMKSKISNFKNNYSVTCSKYMIYEITKTVDVFLITPCIIKIAD